MNGTTPLLHVDGLSAGYDDAAVLHEVTLEVDAGETVALLGPNGHGKTTLLRTISGLHRLAQGGVQFDGENLTCRRANVIAGRGLIHVPQGDQLFPDMTVLENLLVGAYLPHEWRRRRHRLEEVWHIFPEIHARRDTPAGALSGGERRMVAVGRALMGRARLLMIDEPSLGLAPVAIQRLYQALAALKEAGTAMLLVEEAADRIAGIADRVYLMDSGRIIRAGPTAEVLADKALLETYLA